MNKRRKESIEKAIEMAMAVIPIGMRKESYVGGLAIKYDIVKNPRLRADTRITSIMFEIGIRYSHADAFTNNGIGIYAVTRRSNRDSHSPELAIRVLAGKLYHALEAYQEGESLKDVGIRFAAIVPADSMAIQHGDEKPEMGPELPF